MPLIPLPDQGIEVPLSEYNRLRAFQGGGWFWDHDNQQVIRGVLGDFLPRVEEHREKGAALFQHFVGGTEAASRSQAVGTQMNRVPRAEFHRLQRALENLKLKAQDPHTDPNARRVIEKFCLPDPAKDPDLYRIYGSGWNRRLLVLWGCEREEGTSIAPTAALSKIAVETPAATFLRRLPLLLLWLLLLTGLIAGALFWWHHREEQQKERSLATAADVATSENASQTAHPSGADRVSKTPIFQGTPDNGNVTTTPGGNLGASNHLATPSSAADDDRQGSTNDAQTPDQSVATGGETGQDRTSSSKVKAANQTDLTTSERRLDRPDGDSLAVRSTEAATSAHTEQNMDSLRPVDPSGKNLTTGPPNGTNSGVHGTSSQPSSSTASPNATPLPGDRAATAETDASHGASGTPPKVDILKADSSPTLHDGKMDTVLMATAREDDGSAVPLVINRWTVDGTPSRDRAGQDVTTGQLNLTLAPGKHRVNVAGTARGLPVEYETEVEVQIKSQGDVTVKPRAAK